MPKTGFKSITIREETLDKLRVTYQTDGIHSFSGLLFKKLENHIKETQNLRKIASKIDKVPDKFLETKRVIKHD